MCMFSRSVKLVANTRIFARSCAAGRQVLVYSMTMDADEDLAMILPLPIELGIGELDVKFINLSAYPKFFEDLEDNVNIYHNMLPPPRGGSPTKPKLLVR